MSDFKVKLHKKQEFETGATRDDSSDKGRFDLIPDMPLTRLAHVYQKGGQNHGDRNWEKGINFGRLIDSAMRHLTQYKMSKYIPELKEEDHLAHAVWNIFALMHEEDMIQRGFLPQNLDDLPTYKKKVIQDYILDNGVVPDIKFNPQKPITIGDSPFINCAMGIQCPCTSKENSQVTFDSGNRIVNVYNDDGELVKTITYPAKKGK